MNKEELIVGNVQPDVMLRVSDGNVSASVSTAASPTKHNVFENAELLARLYMHQTELGYKLVGFFTACATIYAAIVGVSLQQYFVAVRDSPTAAPYIASLGLALALLSLAAPVALERSLRRIEETANEYAAALNLPVEKFVVVRFGGRLAAVAFVAIGAGWVVLLIRAL